MKPPSITPIQKIENIYVKRDDLYENAGVKGGKARACLYLASLGDYPAGLITASARKSPQAQIVARVAHKLGIPARIHMPTGPTTPEMEDMIRHNAELIRHRPGYNNVLISRSLRDYAFHPKWRYIPFGMESTAAMECTRAQVQGIPKDAKRLVVCVGSGMTLAAILHGLKDIGSKIQVVGVRVGADPTKRLNAYAPFGWQNKTEIINETEHTAYGTEVSAKIGDVVLDPIYEAKVRRHLHPGDLFWIVGIRETI